MGRFTRRAGVILVVTGGQLYRAHEDREIGFRACVRQNFSHIQEALVMNGNDDAEGNFLGVRDVIRKNDDVIGIYNVGGGHQGVVRALKEEGVSDDIVYIGHNLTSRTRSYLLDGSMDIVIHLNVRLVAEQTVEAMIAHLEGRTIRKNPLLTGIITRENINGATFA